MGGFSGPSLVSNGLTFYIDASNRDSYPGSGTTWSDLINNANSGYQALINGPTFDGGNNGTIVLDGTNDYITITQVNSTKYTILLWIKFDTVPGSGTYVLIRQGYSPANYGLYLVNGVLHTYGVGSGGNHFSSTSINLSAGNWYNIAYCKDWDNNNESVYINGDLEYGVSSFSAGTYSFNNTSQSYNYTDLGRNVSNNNSFVDGKYGSCIIYNTILTSSEILHNYNALKSRFGL